MKNEEALSCIATIRFLQNHFLSNHGVFTDRELEDIETVIKKLKQTRWIPCSERLPKTRGAYLVTTKWESSFSSEVYTEIDIAVYRDKLKEWSNPDVIAWMPLPESYKTESEEEK